MYIAVPAEILSIILPLLLGVAFVVLAERKVMAFVQRRKGPDVVGSFGLLQPLADGSKLILKEPISPSSANFSLFRMAPVVTFMLSLVARAVLPFDYGLVLSDPNMGYYICLPYLCFYFFILCTWTKLCFSVVNVNCPIILIVDGSGQNVFYSLISEIKFDGMFLIKQ